MPGPDATAPTHPAARRLPLAALVLLGLLLVLAVHGRALGHGFVHDDRVLLADSARLAQLSSLPEALGRDLFWLADGAVRPSPYWRPVVVGSYYLDRLVGGGAPWAFHLTNLLVLGLLAAVAAAPLRDRLGQLLVLVLVAVHPMQVEVAANISARTDSLAALLGTLAVLSTGAWGAGLTLAALGCKEVAIVVPALAWLRGRGAGEGSRAWMPHLVAAAGWLLTRQVVVARWQVAAEDAAGPTVASVAGGGARALWYLGRAVWPVDPAPARLLPEPGAALALVGWLAVAAGAGLAVVAATKRARGPGAAVPAGLALGLAVLPLLPVSGLLAARVRAAEGFLAWPLVGLAWCAAMLPRGRGALLLLAALGAIGSARHVGAWRDEATLWETAWARYPEDPVVALRVARTRRATGGAVEPPLAVALSGVVDPRERREAHALAALLQLEAGRPEAALEHLAVAADPTDPEATWALAARCTLEAGAPPSPAAWSLVAVCEEALARRPDDADLHNARGVVAAVSGALPEARVHFARAVALAPSSAVFRANLERADRDLARPAPP